MRVRRIFIRNFRSLRYVEINVTQNPLVILGENNVGKSNVLLALRLLLGRNAQRLRLDLSEEDINRQARAQNEDFFTVELEIGNLQNHPDVEVCFKERIDVDGEEHFVRIEGRYEKNTDGEYDWETFLLPPDGRLNDRVRFSRRMYEAIPLFFMDAVRDGEREIRATATSTLSQLLRDVDFNDVELEVLTALRAANTALSENHEIRDLSSGLTQQLRSFVTGGQAELNITVANEELSMLSGNLRLNIRKRPKDSLTALDREGTGLQNLIVISLFRSLMQQTQSEKWRKVPILAIEEPEAHLHPHSQRRLYKELRELSTPAIVTTHSPSLVKYADPSSLVILRSDVPERASAYQLSSSFQLNNRKQLAQLMRTDGAEVLFSRVIIAVEGDSEKIALPAFAEQLGCDLDRDGISILNVGSTSSFAPILAAFAHDELSVHCVVLYDQDVLHYDSKLVKQACDLGLVSEADYEQVRKDNQNVFQSRVSLLNENIGWFGVKECFEECVARNGYFNVMIQAIKDNDLEYHSDYKAWMKFISESKRSGNERDLANFIKKRNSLKIPIAHAVAENIRSTKTVPDEIASAIRYATLQSLGGIVVDESFELRACNAGFRDVLIDFLAGEQLLGVFRDFVDQCSSMSEFEQLSTFYTHTAEGQRVRDKARLNMADAVDKVGCSQFATEIRQTTYSE